MTDYQSVAAQLARVRASWKRAAAFSGLLMMVLEAAALIAVVVVIDLLFGPGAIGRGVLLAATVLAIVYLFVRHVAGPLARRIPDRQIALYVEERSPAFEGALIAAAEFGPTATIDPRHQAIIEAIVREAETRARQFDFRKAIDLSRLKKYGMLALAVFGCYGVAAALFPEAISRHAQRALMPWKPDVVPAMYVAPPPAEAPPIAITLSTTEADLLRGTAFELEATLSRDPLGAVRFHFRPLLEGVEAGTAADPTVDANDGVWHSLDMQRIEKLHGYALVLPDINEPVEFYVSAEQYKSVRGRITVYDPLVIDAMKLTTQYPDYLQLPSRVAFTPNGDVSAVEGSTVTLRIETNRPLAGGSITWDDGETAAMTIPEDEDHVVMVRFEVTTDRTYTYRIEDVGGQVARSAAPAQVSVVKDQPPTLQLVRPTTPPKLMPLGEVTFVAEVSDDFGVAGVDLVYRRGAFEPGEQPPMHRLPLDPNVDESGATLARGLWQMERMEPAVGFGDVLTYYVTVRDHKGQTAESPIEITAVRLYEMWAFEDWTPATGGGGDTPPDVEAVLQAVWMLDQQRSILGPEEFNQQTEELARGAFRHPETDQVWTVFEITPELPPAMAPYYEKFQGMFVDAHDALAAHDSARSIDILQALLTQMMALGLTDSMPQMMDMTSSGSEVTSAFRQETEALAQLENEAPSPERQDTAAAAAADAAAVKAAADEAAGAAEQQKGVVDAAKEMQKQGDNAAPADREDLAGQQEDVAAKVGEIAKQLQDAAKQDGKLDEAAMGAAEAAAKMNEAARQMQTGRLEQAVADAQQAQKQLERVAGDLQKMAAENLANLVDQAERNAIHLRNQQNDLKRRTDEQAKNDANRDDAARDRDYRKLAAEQARLKGELAELEKAIGQLAGAVDRGTVKHETATHINTARRDMRRGRIDQKITNAAVALARQNARQATGEQEQAVAAIEKVLADLQSAGDSLAGDYDAELERAAREAKQLTQAVAQANPEAAKQANEKADAPKDAEQRGEKAAEAAALIGQLQRHVEARKFVDPEKMQNLADAAGDIPSLAGRLETDEETAVGVLRAAQVIEAELAELYESRQQAKRIFAAQREDYPPQYRDLVEKYFEKLSETNARP